MILCSNSLYLWFNFSLPIESWELELCRHGLGFFLDECLRGVSSCDLLLDVVAFGSSSRLSETFFVLLNSMHIIIIIIMHIIFE